MSRTAVYADAADDTNPHGNCYSYSATESHTNGNCYAYLHGDGYTTTNAYCQAGRYAQATSDSSAKTDSLASLRRAAATCPPGKNANIDSRAPSRIEMPAR